MVPVPVTVALIVISTSVNGGKEFKVATIESPEIVKLFAPDDER
jgi:hypothetical protein